MSHPSHGGGKEMIFYDFEVFKHDWLAVFIDPLSETEKVIVNNPEELTQLYEENQSGLWVGFNNKHYDQYIFKGIMLGMNPWTLNNQIIVDGREGWQISTEFNRIPMINYDVMPNPPIGLKTLEGFMGSDIKESDVDFRLDRKLTPEEIQQTIHYCRHDVEETIKVFMKTIDEFNAMKGIVEAFPHLSIADIGDTSARITAKVLQCRKRDWDDEFQYYFLPCLRIKKYQKVVDWFTQKREEALSKSFKDKWEKAAWYKSQSLEINVAGIPHSFGFGGLHGASETPQHYKGLILHVDVNNYYPSLLIAWGLVTRSATNDNFAKVYQTRKELKRKQKSAETKEEAKRYKNAQLPYKKLLNSLTGGMKDETNPAYDPRNNNIMCINGQLMLLDLIEHLEAVEGFQLIQSNTDGLIIQIPDTDEAFNQVDDICYEWERRCSTDKCDILLELDTIAELYQKDVNNYLWIDLDGGVEKKGAYVKDLSEIDNDLPIVNQAVVDFLSKKIPVEKTIMDCDDFLKFQKVVKLSSKYGWVEHEEGRPREVRSGVRVVKTALVYDQTVRYTYKSYRVFASKRKTDGRLLKCGGMRGSKEKFGNTPEHCFICNDDMTGKGCPPYLDKDWYIQLAKKRLKDFGVDYERTVQRIY